MNDECPACGHDRTPPRRWLVALRRWLRLGPPRPYCGYDGEENYTGWSEPCTCRNPWHST